MPGGQQAAPVGGRTFGTVPEIAARLVVSRMTVYRLIHAGELRAYRLGRALRVDPRDLNAYMRRATVAGGAE